MNTGETTANQLYEQAVGGTFRMGETPARRCAANFLRFAEALDPQLENSQLLRNTGGFGGFDSARQLRRGFDAKAADLAGIITDLQDSALRMAAAYLLAAGLIQQTDESHSRALLTAEAGLELRG